MAQLLLRIKKIIQFLDSLMDKRLSFALKRCGFESRSVSFFLLSFNLLVFILDFVYYLNLAYVYSTNTHLGTWIISISRNVITVCTLDDFNTFVVICWLFFKINFFQAFFQEHYQSVKRSISRSGPTFCRYWSGNKLFAKVISRQQKSPLTRKEYGNLGNNKYKSD